MCGKAWVGSVGCGSWLRGNLAGEEREEEEKSEGGPSTWRFEAFVRVNGRIVKRSNWKEGRKGVGTGYTAATPASKRDFSSLGKEGIAKVHVE